MKLKELIKSYGFWTALAGAVVVFVEALGRIIGFTVENALINDIIMAVAGILVVFGVVIMPKSSKTDGDNITDENIDETDKKDDETEKKDESGK